MMETERNQKFIKTVQGLFLLNMVIWLVIGVISLIRLEGGTASPVFLVVALMLLVNAILMGLAAWLLAKRTIWGYLFAIALLGINVLTTFTDQVGFLDFATVLVDIVLLLLLLFRRDTFVAKNG